MLSNNDTKNLSFLLLSGMFSATLPLQVFFPGKQEEKRC